MASAAKFDVESLLAPVPGAKPTGVSLAYEAVYDQIKEARRASDTMDQGDWQTDLKVADWKLVENLAGKALKEKTKDLQLGVWLTEAVARRYGLGGLRDGFKLLKGLLERFWDGLYPEIDDGDMEPRGAPLSWLGSKFAPDLRALELTKSGNEVEYGWIHWDEAQRLENIGRKDPAQKQALIDNEKKVSLEAFDKSVAATPRAHVEELSADHAEATAAFGELDKLADEKFGRDAPSMIDLKKALESVGQLVNRLLKTKREQEPDAGAAAAEAPAEDAGDAPVEDGAPAEGGNAPARPARKKGGSLSAEPESREDAVGRIGAGAAYLRKTEPAGPAAYLVPRGLRWGELRAGGSSPDMALAEPPNTEVRQKLRTLFNESNWESLLAEAETAAAGTAGRAWLDLQRYTVMALSNLGHQAAADAVCSALRAFLKDYPALVDAEMSDGTPAAGNDTKKWLLEASILPKPEEPAAPPEPEPPPAPVAAAPAAGSDAAPAEPDVWETAQKLVKARKAQQAFALIREKVNTAQIGRDRFYRKLQLAELCLMTDKKGLALPLLEELAAEIDRCHIEDWESKEWSARVWGALYRCYKGAQAGDGAEKARQAYARLCRLDITQALAWGEE
jgi:type VI secretion system protein ImpA